MKITHFSVWLLLVYTGCARTGPLAVTERIQPHLPLEAQFKTAVQDFKAAHRGQVIRLLPIAAGGRATYSVPLSSVPIISAGQRSLPMLARIHDSPADLVESVMASACAKIILANHRTVGPRSEENSVRFADYTVW